MPPPHPALQTTVSARYALLFVLLLSACQSPPPPPTAAPVDATMDAVVTSVWATASVLGTADTLTAAAPTAVASASPTASPVPSVATEVPANPTAAPINTVLPAATATAVPSVVIRYFTISPTIAYPGQAVTLTWRVQGANRVSVRVVQPDQRFGPWYNDQPASSSLVYTVPTSYTQRMWFQLVPLPEGAATNQILLPLTATAVAAPQIYFFTASPAEINLGEVVTVSWSGQGEKAVLNTVDYRGRLNPGIPVPLSGTQVLTTTGLMGQPQFFAVWLFISAGNQYTSTMLRVPVRCPGYYAWFFANPPTGCAGFPAERTNVQAQRFEHGLMLWTGYNHVIYTLLDGGTRYWVDSDLWLEGMPVDDPTLTPPPGLFQPLRGFGLLWRTEASYGLRNLLGWATGPEFTITDGAFQCDNQSYTTCYISGPGGVVYRLKPEFSGWDVWQGP